MNNIQKILLMVFFMSVTIFIVTAYIFNTSGSGATIWKYIATVQTSSKNTGITLETHTNWLGIIALGNSVASLVGFFLFKDKK